MAKQQIFNVPVLALTLMGASAARPAHERVSISTDHVSQFLSKAAFNALDEDKNNQVSFAEFTSALGHKAVTEVGRAKSTEGGGGSMQEVAAGTGLLTASRSELELSRKEHRDRIKYRPRMEYLADALKTVQNQANASTWPSHLASLTQMEALQKLEQEQAALLHEGGCKYVVDCAWGEDRNTEECC